MTSTNFPTPTTRRTPGLVVLVRVLVAVQVLIGLGGIMFVGLFAALAFGWRVSGHTDMTAAVVGVIAVLVVLVAFVCALIVAAARLGRGDRRPRAVLVALEVALLAGLLLLTPVVGGRLGFGGAPGPALVLGLCAAVSLIALLGRPADRS